ncbi:MAG: hypothetical protein PHN55_09625 [Dysgonamonadaceae bacterium]|nr:hypothetical protein [Dysgonamonadaceae bacterium]
MKNNQFRLRLLPNYFKKIGLGILVLTVLFFSLRLFNVLSFDKTLVLTISIRGVLVSLLILAMSKEKLEDELTAHIRLLSLGLSFITGVVAVIILPFIAMLIGTSGESFQSSSSILIFMFIMYFTSFRSRLKKR